MGRKPATPQEAKECESFRKFLVADGEAYWRTITKEGTQECMSHFALVNEAGEITILPILQIPEDVRAKRAVFAAVHAMIRRMKPIGVAFLGEVWTAPEGSKLPPAEQDSRGEAFFIDVETVEPHRETIAWEIERFESPPKLTRKVGDVFENRLMPPDLLRP